MGISLSTLKVDNREMIVKKPKQRENPADE